MAKTILFKTILTFLLFAVITILIAMTQFPSVYLRMKEMKARYSVDKEIAAEIEKVITSALNAGYAALVSDDMQKLQSDLEGLYSDEALAMQTFNDTKLFLHGFSNEKISGKFTFYYSDSELSEKNAVVVMTEESTRKINNDGEPWVLRTITRHKFTLEKRGGKWHIIGDHFLQRKQFLR